MCYFEMKNFGNVLLLFPKSILVPLLCFNKHLAGPYYVLCLDCEMAQPPIDKNQKYQSRCIHPHQSA